MTETRGRLLWHPSDDKPNPWLDFEASSMVGNRSRDRLLVCNDWGEACDLCLSRRADGCRIKNAVVDGDRLDAPIEAIQLVIVFVCSHG